MAARDGEGLDEVDQSAPRTVAARAVAELAASAAAVAPVAPADDDIDAALEDTPRGTGLVGSDRVYMVCRTATILALGLVYVADRVREVHELAAVNGTAFAVGIALLVTAGVVAILTRVALGRSQQSALAAALPFDVVAAGLLVVSTGPYHEPVYPWLLFLVVAYAVAFAGRRGWAVSVVIAVLYLAAHLPGDWTANAYGSLVLVAFNAAALVFVGSATSAMVLRRIRHEEWLTASQRDVLDLNELLSRRLGELRAVSEINDVIHSTLDFDAAGPRVLEILSQVLDLPASALFVIDSEQDETVFSASSGISAATARGLPHAHSLGQPHTADAEMFECTTLLDHNGLLVVFCATGDWLQLLSAEDRLVLQAVASELVVAVENSQLYKLTKRLSMTDELTGLYNYRYLQQRLDDEIERARRYDRSLSLLMIDADDFKQYNDTYGHLAGDAALAEMGEVLRASVRDIDVACRYGGEEFAIVLPETDADGAFVVAEKTREAVGNHRFLDGEGLRTVRLSISIGLAAYPSGARDREGLLRQADEALYQAKRQGRDRVCAPASEPSETAPPFGAVAIEGGTP